MPLTWLGVVPFLAFAFVFLGLPAVLVVVGAFTDSTAHPTFANLSILTQHNVLNAYQTSIAISAVSSIGGAIIGFLLAYAALHEASYRWIRPILVTFSGVASNFAGVPLAYAFISTLGFAGTLTLLLQNVFHVSLEQAGFSLYTFWGLALIYLYFQIPLMVLLMVPTIQGLRREWREASESLGASPAQFWLHVGLPILTPPVLAASLLLFGNAFGAYATAYALAQGGINLVSILIGYFVAGNVTFDPNAADAMAAGMIVIMSFCILVFTVLQRRTSRWIR